MMQLLTLAALTLAPTQNAPLAITNDRITFCGEFGPARTEAKLLPGDLFFLAFDIENLKPDADGRLQYALGVEITDGAGKAVYSEKPVDNQVILLLGGSKLPARVFWFIPTDQPKGQYHCRVTVTDRQAKVTKTLDKPFEILPAAFGIAYVYTTVDEDGLIPAPLQGVVGQPLFVHFRIVGFARDAGKQPNVVVEVRVVDSDGKPTTAKPLKDNLRRAPNEKSDIVLSKIAIPLSRAGSFTVEIKADCKVSGQASKLSIPIRVQAPGN
jgi:hypothetical protein